jgi:hypothetical protein
MSIQLYCIQFVADRHVNPCWLKFLCSDPVYKNREQSWMANKLILIFSLLAQKSMILKQGTGCLTFQSIGNCCYAHQATKYNFNEKPQIDTVCKCALHENTKVSVGFL